MFRRRDDGRYLDGKGAGLRTPAILLGTVSKSLFRVLAALGCVWSAALGQTAQTGTLPVLTEELERNFAALKKTDPAPYFLSYEVTDQDYAVISASFGAITNQRESRSSNLDITVRVGSPKLDNYHRIRGDRAQFTNGSSVVIENNPLA